MREDEINNKFNNSNMSPEKWLASFIRIQGMAYDYKTDSIRLSGLLLDYKLIVSKMRLSLHSQDITHLKDYVTDALRVWRFKQASIALNEIRNNICARKADDRLVSIWVQAVTGEGNNLDIAVVKHFVWQVKRKLSGLEVEHHMMPVLFGKSGGGKSVAVHKLLKPLEDISLRTDMSVFGDRFSKMQFTRNFIMFFDELEGIHQVDVNKLKHIITAPVIEWRTMRSEGVNSGAQNCTFIGCSNEPVSERIKDTTSARRFWQLNCLDKLGWDVINATDYLTLWRSVDENGPCPILPYINEIKDVQESSLRARDMIEEWLEMNCKPCPFNDNSPTTNLLYENFMAWCEWQKISHLPSFQKFSKDLQCKLSVLKWDVKSRHAHNGTVWALMLQP